MKTNIQESAQDLIYHIASKLLSIYPDNGHAKNRAWDILQFVTGYTKAQLIVNSQINISALELQKIAAIIQAHVEKQKPIQYIFKHIPFIDLNIQLKEGILIPRPETEYWCNELIENLKSIQSHKNQISLTILDICTGTGCIALSLAKAFPLSTIYALDISSEACHLAKINAHQNNIKNVVIIKSDLYQKLPNNIKFDIIVSNPPYISYKRWKALDPMVKKWESPLALTAKKGGTYLIKKIIKQAHQWLKPNTHLKKAGIPQLILEMDDNQAKKISKLLKHYGFGSILVKKDASEMDRVIEASLNK